MSEDIFDFVSARLVPGVGSIYIVDDLPATAEAAEALDSLLASFPTYPERRPGGITAVEAMKLWGVSRSTANRRLRKLEADGKMVIEVCRVDGRTLTKVYYIAEEPCLR